MALPDLLERGALFNPDDVCMSREGRRLLYRAARSLTRRVANTLLARGHGAGGHAAVLCGNDPTGFVCNLGVMRAGMAYVPMDWCNNPDEDERILTFATSSCRSSSGDSPIRRGHCGHAGHAFVAFCLFWMPDPAAVLAAIGAHRVTKLFLPPTAIYRLLDDPARTRHDLSSLRRLAYPAAPMNTTRLRESVDALLARRPPHDHAWRAGRADRLDRGGNANPWSLRRRRARARSPVAVNAIPCRRFASGGRSWPKEVNPPCRRTGASREGRCGSRRRAPIARTGRAP